MKKVLFPAFFLVLLGACDPGLTGNLRVFNKTYVPITVKVYEYGGHDSASCTIQPGTVEIVKVLGGLGDKSRLDCCPCELDSFVIRSAAGPIKKDPQNGDNWLISNKDKLTRFGDEPARCEFYVMPSDL